MRPADFDVIVVGAGNAGLSAAIRATENGASVLVIEKAQLKERGGNSALTMNFRFPHCDRDELLRLVDPGDQSDVAVEALSRKYEPYPATAFIADLVKTSAGRCDMKLAETLATGASQTISWLRSLGHRWEVKPNILAGSVPVRLKGGGSALQEANFAIAERLGVRFRYSCALRGLLTDAAGRVVGIDAEQDGRPLSLQSRSVVLACGGFQANPVWRAKWLGQEWEGVRLRGVPFNTGDGLAAAQRVGSPLRGDFGGCHATPQAASLPDHVLPGDQQTSQRCSRYAFSYGITLNRSGERFFDEGQDMPNFVYAKLGAKILQQPGQLAYQLFDQRTAKFLPPSYIEDPQGVSADTLEHLASKLDIARSAFLKTVNQFNGSTSPRPIDLTRMDGVGTRGLEPPKSNWALGIHQPPFYAFPVTTGITFTYGGLPVDARARVLGMNREPIPNLFACGEIVGGLFYGNYAGGSGLMAGAVLGRIAADEIARTTRSQSA